MKYKICNPLSLPLTCRLDDRDRNGGCKVAGYGVYVDGVQRTKVNEPFGSHVEMDGLENGAQYQIQVRCVCVCVEGSWIICGAGFRHRGCQIMIPISDNFVNSAPSPCLDM